tara:strand:+ start:537 stop:752 length:216 start_codon:yes stop_codon:yes gene_type:complete
LKKNKNKKRESNFITNLSNKAAVKQGASSMFAEPVRHQHSSLRTYISTSGGSIGYVPMEEMHYISVKHAQY